jgi:hypothetical protein
MSLPTKDELLDDIKSVWALLGRRPTSTEFVLNGKYKRHGMTRVRSEYGSWTAAVNALAAEDGFHIQGTKFTRVTKQTLRVELMEISKRLIKENFEYDDYKALGGTYSIGTFSAHFGSWREAVASIGQKAGGPPYFSNEEYFTEMRRVQDLVGKRPTSRDMRRLGAISPNAFLVRFGGWLKAVDAFEKWLIPLNGATLTREEATEGRRLLKLHKFRERKRRIVRRKKQSVLKATGLLLCEVCEFDFAAVYGKLGEGFAECHHRLPLAENDAEKPTLLTDLAIVCANCHRILHRSRPMMKVEELRSLILQRRAEP